MRQMGCTFRKAWFADAQSVILLLAFLAGPPAAKCRDFRGNPNGFPLTAAYFQRPTKNSSRNFTESVRKISVTLRALPSVRDLSGLTIIEVAHIHPLSAHAQIGLRCGKARFPLRDCLCRCFTLSVSRKYAANGVRFGNSVVLPRAVNYFPSAKSFRADEKHGVRFIP